MHGFRSSCPCMIHEMLVRWERSIEHELNVVGGNKWNLLLEACCTFIFCTACCVVVSCFFCVLYVRAGSLWLDKVLFCGCLLNNAIHSFVAVSLCGSYPCEIGKLCSSWSLLMHYFRELIVSGKDRPHSFSRKQQIDDKFILFVDFYL